MGSKNTPIYETYLEQKSGFRILWTEEGKSILIWFVSPHDRVTTHMKRIDESQSRTDRQLVTVEELEGFREEADDAEYASEDEEEGEKDQREDGDDEDLDANKVHLDPYGDVPLKTYMLRYDDIPRFASSQWMPPLHMTTEERLIVEKNGTVLLLGRSGTGKTVCIINRMDRDRHHAEEDQTFSQWFIARSSRICSYVRDNVGKSSITSEEGTDRTIYDTFQKFLERCEDVVYHENHPFPKEKRVDFRLFKHEFANVDCGTLDLLTVWTQIRSFIKGSIEACIEKGRDLELNEYLNKEIMGENRCTLSSEDRKQAYEVYLKYTKWLFEGGLWDDCDRAAALVRDLRSNDKAREQLVRSRVYVDEIQVSTA